jgi:hypothetical protein
MTQKALKGATRNTEASPPASRLAAANQLPCNQCAANYYGYPACRYCLASATCNGDGTCSDTGACTCHSGYAGPACQYADTTTCSGHGLAQRDGTCACFAGYSGARRDQCAADYYHYPRCTFCRAEKTCGDHGSCSAAGDCTCHSGFVGPACQFSDSGTCHGHGTAQADGSCVCSAPFSGAACGQCVDGYADYPKCAAATDAGAGDIDSGLTAVDAGSSASDAGASGKDGGPLENDGGSKAAHAASGCGCSALADVPVLNALVPALLALGVRRRRYPGP